MGTPRTIERRIRLACATITAATASLIVFAASTPCPADTIRLKDGAVVEGEIFREGEKFIYVRIPAGETYTERFFMRDQIESIERDEEPVAADPRPKYVNASERASPETTRVAELVFGPPSSWQGAAGDTVGLHITAADFQEAIPLLEEDEIDIVVIRVNSLGSGCLREVEKFHEVFREYKHKFRTLTWIENALSTAAMSIWVIEEQSMMPGGNIGACTLYGPFNTRCGDDLSLDTRLELMEKASRDAWRNPLLMLAMQTFQPLSVSTDPVDGTVTYYDNAERGDIKLNDDRSILVLTAPVAEKIRFSKATAATLDELMTDIGVREYELGGEKASMLIEQTLRDATEWEKTFGEVYTKFTIAAEAAVKLRDDEEHAAQRRAQATIAGRHLNELRQLAQQQTDTAVWWGTDDEWFEAHERLLKELAR